ncbi:hypothetical protein [Candidatus Tisiphia endosymbiont of Piscicola geometra]|uniref:hypothetical protein n=1 Tax=Candidatus Tisiphia endosymbiont of Piscicola geometra TaxID=3066273 RepID=UPI00312CA9F6
MYKNNQAHALNAQGIALETEGYNATDPTTKIAKYELARLRYKEAEELTTNASNKTIYKKNQALMLNKQGIALETEGDNATNTITKIAKYELARLRYKEAEELTTDASHKTMYKNNQAHALNAQGIALETEGYNATDPTTKIAKYELARLRYKEAEELTTDASHKTMYKNNQAHALDAQGIALDTEGNNSTNTITKVAKYEAARLRFKEAEELTTNASNKTIYKNNQALLLDRQGQLLVATDPSGAIAKYNEALCKANDWYTIASIKNNQAAALNDQGRALETEGDNATNTITKIAKYEAARLRFKEAEELTLDASNKSLYKDNQALMLNKQGHLLVATDPAGAIAKYNEALCKANRQDTIDSIKNNQAAALNAQGRALDTEGNNSTNTITKIAKYEAARLRFKEAEELTTKTIYENNQALMLNKQGQLLVATDPAGAIAKYNEALCKANRQNTIDSIKNNQAAALNAQGQALETEGNNATDPTTRMEKYEAAYNKYQEAWDQCSTNRAIDLDVYNNNKANILHSIGLEFYNKGDYLKAENYFNQAYYGCTGGFKHEQVFKDMSDKAKANYTAEQQHNDMPRDSFIQAQDLITKGMSNVESLEEKENTIIIGNTRGGKSTVINYLLSNPLKVTKLDPNAKGKDGKVLKIFAVDPTAGPEIGATGGSMTTVPKKWYNPDGAYKKAIWDCPGFGDNRGPAVEISNAYLLSKLLSNARNIKIVLVSDIDDITSDNPAGFVRLIKQVNYLFGDLDKIKNCSVLLVTKVKNYDVNDIVADITKIAKDVQDPELDKAFVQHLADNKQITIFAKAREEGLLDSKDAEMIAKDINQIDSERQLPVKVGISPDTKVFIYKNSSVLLDDIMECFKILSLKLSSSIDVTRIKTTGEAETARIQLIEMVKKLNFNDYEVNIKDLIKRIPSIFEEQKQWTNYKNRVTDKEIAVLSAKLDLVFFIKSINSGLETLEIDDFRTDLISAGHKLSEAITTHLLILQQQENKITQEQMQEQIAKVQKQAEETRKKLQEESEQMRKLQNDYNAETAKQKASNAELLKKQVMYVTREEYDNPLLNKPRVIEEYISKFGKKSFDDLLTLTSKLEKIEVKEVLEQQNPIDSLAMLMGLDSEVYNVN